MNRKKSAFLHCLLLVLVFPSCLSLVDKKALAREYASLGEGYFELKQYEKAEGYFSRASELDPKLPLNSFQLAKTFAENGQLDRSFSLVEDLLSQEPQNIVFLGLKAYILQKKGKTEEARLNLETILALSPYSKDALFNIGVIEFGADEYQKAYESWDRLLTIDPADSEAMLLLAKAAFKTDKAERGFQLLENFSALKPSDYSALRMQAKQRYERREYSLALQAYEALVAKDPGKPEDWFDLATLAMQAAEDRDRSLEALKKALELGFKDTKRIQDFIDSLPMEEREAFNKIVSEKKKQNSPEPTESPKPESTPKPEGAQ